jgi:glycosyltransferase involved in cell wall biosynthesis
MKIVEIINTFSQGGGVNSFVYDLSKRLTKMNENVTIIAINKSDFGNETVIKDLSSYGINTISLDSNGKYGFIFRLYRLRKIIIDLNKQNQQPLIINTHLKVSEVSVFFSTLFLKNIKVVTTYHSFYRKYGLISFFLKHKIKHYIAVSNESKNELIDKFHIKSEKVSCIYNGIDVSAIASAVSNNMPINPERIAFLSVGRFTSQKQFDLSIKAFIEISINYQYTIIGDGPDSLYLKKIALNNPKIVFLGKLERHHVFNEISRSDMVIVPSKHEGNSILLLEILALKKPVILTDIAAFREVTSEKPLGINEVFRICDWGCLVQQSTDSIAAAIIWISHNRDALKSMSESIGKIANKFDISTTAHKYLSIYKEV